MPLMTTDTIAAIASCVGTNGCWNSSGISSDQLKKNESLRSIRRWRTWRTPWNMVRATCSGSSMMIS